ncbi:alpha/beta fold hydrolase [Nocardiopsis sp. L17-MgMaSL7]|uniref:alpha/beta fold hydrolase n=1 Tax=Nocardiopsis sp. L17-MgMaSL7 TaxID=1938893 RepID=UPI000D70B7E2|nr:alpha/beta hydrolase [Nocardiopsis sp. L17-MgMaSL7]PWV44674.1 pimeloyl-ACP methyl ester carboxylesterase [Nocardiopsis sp. L17-MgMaSL7]
MRIREITLDLGRDTLAGLDFGGEGTPVLLVHGSGHNAAAWTDVAAHLTDRCRVVAVDLRGHGRTAVDSENAEQYWCDLADAARALGWENPVLVGHSLGGYAVTAVAAAGLLRPAAVCVVDGLVLNTREKAVADQAQWTTPAAGEALRAQFRYGWSATPDEAHAYIDQCVREAQDDDLNRGSRPGLVREVLERSFTQGDRTRLRRPTPEQVAVISAVAPEAVIHPSLDVYERVTCPLTIVLPEEGFYAGRREEVRAVVAARPERTLVEMRGHHNVTMARPEELARIILDLVNRLPAPESGEPT